MSLLLALRQRLRELVRPGRVDTELDEELRDHFEREVSRQASTGTPPDDARRRALLRSGRLDLAREAVGEERSGRLIADTARDLRFALRALRRTPGFVAAVVISLALGIGGTTAIFGVVYAVLMRPLPFTDPDQLHVVRIWWNDFSASLSPADFLTLREQSRGVAAVGAYFLPDDGFAMSTPDGPELVDGAFITDELPRVLGVAPLLGRGFSADPSASEVFIGESLWRRRFGGRGDVVGRTLTLDGEAFAIVGVLPKGFNLPGQRNEVVWVRPRPTQPTRRGPFYMTAIARLAPGVSRELAESRLTSAVMPVMRERYGITNTWRYGLRPLKDVLVGDVRETLLLTFGAVTLVLIIAVANVTNLLLARGTVRTRELAVRASLGAGRARLARQLLAESGLLGLAGGALGLLFAFVLTRIAGSAVAVVMPGISEVRLDSVTMAFALTAGVVAGLLAGTFPALRLPWGRLGDWLREGGRTGSEGLHHGRARRVLVVSEIALTLTVVTGAALLVKSLVKLQDVDPGFRSEGVLSFRLSLPSKPYEDHQRLSAFMTGLDTRLRGLPGVWSVAVAGFLPGEWGGWTNNYTTEGAVPDNPGAGGVAEWNVVSGEYFSAMGIRLVRGRVFDTTERADGPPSAIVNESFARRHFPNGDVLGKRLKGGDWDPRDPWTTIVGVVADVPYEKGLWGGAGETVYTAFNQNLWLQSSFVVIKSGDDPARLVPAARNAVTSLDRRVPLRDVKTMSERLRRSTATPRLRGLLFSLLGALALALAVTGIYGVMAYHVNQRRRETAIRRALGATSGQVLGTTLGAGLRLAALGIAIGTACALALTRSLSALLYHVDPHDPGVIASVAALLAIAALVACAVPAARAAAIDPATILRDE